MKPHEVPPIEKNDLAEGLKAIAAKAKAAKSSNFRFVLLLLALGGIVGAWLYLRGTGRTSDADAWRHLEALGGLDDFEKFAETYANTSPGRAAQLQQARILLAQGIDQLTKPAFDADARKKTVEKVEKARELFAKLAGEFKDDLTLRAQCYEGAAKAELSLVGVPKADGNLTDDRGSVKKAAEYYRDYAKTVGEATPPGEAALKKAKEIEEKESEIKALGSGLNNQYAPKPAADIKLPGDLTAPKDPLKPIEPSAPGKVDAPKSDPSIPPPPKVDDPKTPSIPPPPKKDEPKTPAGEKK